MIIQLDEAKRTLLQKKEEINELASALKLDELRQETAELEKKTLGAETIPEVYLKESNT